MDRFRPQPQHIRPAQVMASLNDGVRLFARTWRLSMTFAACFALTGVALLAIVIRLGFAPMSVPLGGGFLLVAPALLAGFFAVARASRAGRRPGWGDVASGFRDAPAALWGLLLVCGLLFVIWMTDAAVLYSFVVGGSDAGGRLQLPLLPIVMRFELGAAVAGAFFALIVFCVTAYGVPLLIERRANLVTAVSASVRAVFASLPANLAWAGVLATTVFAAVLVPPLLAAVLPVMAYATESMYRAVFPAADDASRDSPHPAGRLR